jgi:type I restriction enzyme S subunit
MEEKVPKRITDEITLDLPRNWESRSLNELCKIKIGGTPKTNIKSFWNGSIKWATAKDISNTSGRFIQKTEKTITKEGSDRSAAKILPANTIVITARGTVGKMAITPEPMAINQTCYGLLAENIDNMFLYYSVKSAIEKLMGVSYGTVFDTITIKSFENIRLLVPNNRAEQRAIAKILSDLDSKIELNQKMNKTLEAIAQAIFKHWFIDFEFPNEEGKPYKSSGGEMVDSELGEIPKRWEVKKIRDVLREISSGSRPKGGIDKKLCNGIPSIGAENINGLGHYDFSKTRYVSDGFFEKNQKGMVMDRDVLLYKDGAQLGRKTIFGGGFPFIKCMVNEHVFILRVREELRQSYLYFWLDRNDVTDAIRNLNTNSAQPGLNKEAVGSLRILVPQLHILSEFDLLISFLLNRIFNNSLQSKTIDEIRDLLLPKLVSGKIRVPLEE